MEPSKLNYARRDKMEVGRRARENNVRTTKFFILPFFFLIIFHLHNFYFLEHLKNTSRNLTKTNLYLERKNAKE